MVRLKYPRQITERIQVERIPRRTCNSTLGNKRLSDCSAVSYTHLTRLYEACDILAKQMERGADMEDLSKLDAIMGVEQEESGDFVVNEKDKVVNLTEPVSYTHLDVYKRQRGDSGCDCCSGGGR